MIDLSVVIVSYKCKDYLEKCLRSLFRGLGGVKSEVIVVENDSQDGSYEMVAREFPQVKLIASANIGFGPGNSLAMKRAKGRYVLLLNPDTEVKQKNIFPQMVDWMDKHPRVGVSTCGLLNPDGSFQGTGGSFPTLLRVFAWMFFIDDLPFVDRLLKPYHPLHPWSFFYSGEAYFKKAHEQDWITGAFFLIRNKVIEEVGYFDKEYFMYVEEVEYSKRIKDAGWEIWYLPRWRIIHYGQASSSSEFATTSEYKGLRIYYKRHEPSWKMPLLKLCLKVGALLRIIIFGVLKGPKVARVYVKAFQIA